MNLSHALPRCLAIVFLLSATALSAAEPERNKFLPCESFTLEGRPAFVAMPPKDKQSQPQPWVMYAPTLNPYPSKDDAPLLRKVLDAGVAVAGIDAGEAYGSPKGQKAMSALYNELTKNRHFAAKPCLLGRSRGGLWVSSWAIANPDKVAGIAGIYPVFDLRSYPGLEKAAPSFELTAPELESKLDELNPISKVETLAKAKLPVYIIHGDIDELVPLEKNSGPFAEIYKANDAEDAITLFIAKGQGHSHWEGFFQHEELIEFVIERAKGGAEK